MKRFCLTHRVWQPSLLLAALLVRPALADEVVEGRLFNLGPFDVRPTNPTTKSNRLRVFRNMPSFLNDTNPTDAEEGATPEPVDNFDWLEIAAGNDNPYFDVRRPGDPGGVGYFRLHSQMQVFETKTTGCSITLRAVTPAGREWDGLAEGQTVVSPSVTVFHTLDNGTAIQGFLGRNVRLDTWQGAALNRALEAGFAVQQPVTVDADGQSGLFFFVETLCRYRYSAVEVDSTPAVWEVLPGVHWKMGEKCWMSGGVIVPVNGDRVNDRGLWQVTCWMKW